MGSREIAEAIKGAITMAQVVECYGFHPDRSGFIQCPFHQGDHTASLKLYEGDGGWHCFGCGRGGSVIDFVMELFDLTFQQAVIRLSSDFHLGLAANRGGKKEVTQLIAQRKAAAQEREQAERNYMEMAREHCYWWEVLKYFAPTDECAETGYIHPLYAEAVKRLPHLEYWLDENLGGDSHR